MIYIIYIAYLTNNITWGRSWGYFYGYVIAGYLLVIKYGVLRNPQFSSMLLSVLNAHFEMSFPAMFDDQVENEFLHNPSTAVVAGDLAALRTLRSLRKKTSLDTGEDFVAGRRGQRTGSKCFCGHGLSLSSGDYIIQIHLADTFPVGDGRTSVSF